MLKTMLFAAAATLVLPAAAVAAPGPSDPQIAHVAYTAGQLDIAAARQALAKSRNASVRSFAREMLRDHKAVNDKALALVRKLKVTPQDNDTSAGLTKSANATRIKLNRLKGAAFDRAYLRNEVDYHRTVNSALEKTLIPETDNGELKALLQTGLTLFREHQAHAEHLARRLK